MNVADRLKAIENGWKPKVFKTILSDGSTVYKNKNFKLHNEYDLPAVIWANNSKFWYKNGKRHRDGDLPAIVYPDGFQAWYKNDKLYREGNKPVALYADGSELFKKKEIDNDRL